MSIQALSVVIPVYNEQDNVKPLAEEIVQALTGVVPFEVIFVDDASKDSTKAEIVSMSQSMAEIKLVPHRSNRGQSAAVVSGVRRAQYEWIATLDGDRQNDPKDLVALINAVNESGLTQILCMGQRMQRQDNWLRKCSSKIANKVRRSFLKDDCPDSGCGIKIFPKQLFLTLPLFKNCHRFLPVLFARAGAKLLQVPVSHRERASGQSKYGVMNRLWVGIVDMIGVAWLMKRFIEVEGDADV